MRVADTCSHVDRGRGITVLPTPAGGRAGSSSSVRSAGHHTAVYRQLPLQELQALNKKYRHGVGQSNAHDKSSSKKVTTFTHNTALYKKIIAKNHGLDRDHDGIACEKR